MSLMPGRNDPCPCGSGRKYKKCCGDPLADDRLVDALIEEDCARGAELLAEYNRKLEERCGGYE